MSLKKELENYIALRKTEGRHTNMFLCCIPYGMFNKSIKLGAATKMLNDLTPGSKPSSYSEDELRALRQGRLGKRIGKHSRDWPANFSHNLRRMRDNDERERERDHLSMVRGYPYF